MRRSLLLILFVATAATAFSPVPAVVDDRPTPAYAATPEDAYVRPGAGVGEDLGGDPPMTEIDAYCTYDWVFHDVVEPDPETGEYPTPKAYIGTAGHCTDDVGERMSIIGGGEIGTVVYDSDLGSSGVDFSLVELDPQVVGDTHPQMRGFAAPTGYAKPADLAEGQFVGIHGYGVVLGQNDLTRTREGVLVAWNDDEYVADMPAVNGDSGAPLVLSESGLALGIISRYGFGATPPSTDTGPLLNWVLRELDAAGFKVELATMDD